MSKNTLIDEEKISNYLTEQIKLSRQLTLLLIGVASFYALFFTVTSQTFLAVMSYIVTAILYISFLLHQKQYFTLSKIILFVNTLFALFFFTSVLGKETGIHLFNLAVIPASLVIFSERETFLKYLFAVLSSINFLALSINPLPFPISIVLPDAYILLLFVSISLMSFGVSFASVQFFKDKFLTSIQIVEKQRDEKEKYIEELSVTNTQLIDAHEQLQTTLTHLTQETKEKEASLLREFENAKQLEAQAQLIRDQEANKRLLAQAKEYQDTLYQNTPPKVEKQAISAHGVASHHISGDYRYMKALAPKLSASVVLDVTGHGAPAAMMTGILAKLVDEWMESEDIEILKDPSKALDALNKILCREPRITRFVAGIYMVVDTQTYQAHIACAGSEAPLIYRNNTLIPIPSVNTSLCMDEDSTYDTVTVPIHPNDILIASTDGLVDLTLATPKDTPTLLVPRLEGPLDDYGDPIPILDYTTLTHLLNKSLKPTPIPETGTTKSRSKPLATKIGDILHKTCLPSKDDMTMVVVGVA